MERYFPHEKLEVYGIALRFAAFAGELVDSWPAVWAVRDQLDRATESVVTNLAKAARLRDTEGRIYCIECSLGSALECAACLDVAHRRHMIDLPRVENAKKALQTVARMEVKLRASWEQRAKEDVADHSDAPTFFLHESLDVYQRSLDLHESLVGLWPDNQKPGRHLRRIDQLSTSLTLNIAEGNGRFSKLDHRKFIDTALDAGTKLAAFLDLTATRFPLNVDPAKSNLRPVMAMLAGLHSYLQE